MKTCGRCREEKSIDEFSRNKNKKSGRASHCKSCASRYFQENRSKIIIQIRVATNATRVRLRRFVDEYKRTRGCATCPEREPAALDMHHEKTGKERTISKAVNNAWSLKKLKTELEKCRVLCANCHRKFHAGLLVLPIVPSGM